MAVDVQAYMESVKMTEPILYSFRRCPYAMRARMALLSAGITVELREIEFRNKPRHMLACSPKGTVPVLVLPDNGVLEESRDIMFWSLAQHDPDGWLSRDTSPGLSETDQFIHENDFVFKPDLDRYKYFHRFGEQDGREARERASRFVQSLEMRLSDRAFLFGDACSVADAALFPFIRQFAHVDRDWFYSQNWNHAIRWLNHFLELDAFHQVMHKYPVWQENTPGERFPPEIHGH
jgi:glutathione S-transferase